MLFKKELSEFWVVIYFFVEKKSVNNLKCLVFEAKQFFLFFVTSTFLVSPRDNGFLFDYHQMYVEIDSLKT